MGVRLLHDLIQIFLIDGLYSVIWYIDIMQQLTLIYYIYPRVRTSTEVNVTATVGMSATVGGNVHNSGEMSATGGVCPQQWGN